MNKKNGCINCDRLTKQVEMAKEALKTVDGYVGTLTEAVIIARKTLTEMEGV